MSLERFKYRFIKLHMLIGSDFVHYVIKQMTKGREMLAGTGTAVESKTGKGRQLAKHLEALGSLVSEDAI